MDIMQTLLMCIVYRFVMIFSIISSCLCVCVCVCDRGVKASHVLISSSGVVNLTGVHNSFCTVTGGQRLRSVHNFPEHAVDCLQWFSPEILEQVGALGCLVK